MAGMFPTSFVGGVVGAVSVPYSYVLQLSTQPAILYYSGANVTLTQAQMNSILGEFACIFDHAGWTYQPGAPGNLWGALEKVFSPSGAGLEQGAVTEVNGHPGPVVTLDVADIAGAAPLNSPNLTGIPTAPTRGNSDASQALATTQFVQNVVVAAVQSAESIPNATELIYGLARFATPAEVIGGVSDVAVDAATLKTAVSNAVAAAAGTDLFTVTFPVTSSAPTIICPRSIGSWTALYVNGLRQDPSMYSINGQSLTLLAVTANVGDFCVFDYVSL